jgi:Tachylectin
LSNYVYGIKSNGDLHWYRHTDWQNGTTGEGQFRGGNKVGEGWNTFRTVFATSNGIIYGIKPNGDLHWYQHTDWQNGTTGEGHFRGGNKVGEGWNIFQTVFATSNGIIYGIKPNGDLHWYQHTDWQNGTTGERHFRGGNKVGEGWNTFRIVFATSDGIIYGIKPNGDLHWYQHTDWQNGTTGEGHFRGGNKVGEGWNIFQTVFASGNGVIYGTN